MTRLLPGGSVVRRTGVLIVALAALAAGCTPTADPDAGPTPDQTPDPVADATPEPTAAVAELAPAPPTPALPASAAGGACHLLDYLVVFAHLELAFDVSAARKREDARTCVVRATADSLPDLALTVVPTSTDPDDFTEDLLPEDGEEVDRLGRIGYHAAVEATRSRGPGLEVVWLSGDGRLLTLVLTLPTDTTAANAGQYADGLLDLARAIDRLRI